MFSQQSRGQMPHDLSIGGENGNFYVRRLGESEGDLRATVSVTVRESGVVTGNIVAPSVAITEGATFNGSIEMRSPSDTPKKKK